METRKIAASAAALALAGSLTGCMTTPGLNFDGSKSGPTVTDIRNHIYCELRNAALQPNEYITVLLTLQVDDNIDLTPAITYTQVLHKPSTSLATALGADFGVARKRTFTTTYTLDSNTVLESKPTENAQLSGCGAKGYDLKGDLKLGEVVEDGKVAIGTLLGPKPPTDAVVAGTAMDKATPSYGSQIQFIITRSLTAFGPTWTLRYAKFPSDKNGLFNGKRLDTDSILITFAPHKPGPPSAATSAAKEVARVAVDQLQDSQDRLGDANAAVAMRTKRKSDADDRLRDAQRRAPLVKGAASAQAQAEVRARTSDDAAADEALGDAQTAVARANKSVQQANARIAAANQAVVDSQARDETASRGAAIAATKDQLTTMLLQNLVTVPPNP